MWECCRSTNIQDKGHVCRMKQIQKKTKTKTLCTSTIEFEVLSESEKLLDLLNLTMWDTATMYKEFRGNGGKKRTAIVCSYRDSRSGAALGTEFYLIVTDVISVGYTIASTKRYRKKK